MASKGGAVAVYCAAGSEQHIYYIGVCLGAGKEGEYEKEGYGKRPYDNWERIMFDCRGQDFDTVSMQLWTACQQRMHVAGPCGGPGVSYGG